MAKKYKMLFMAMFLLFSLFSVFADIEPNYTEVNMSIVTIESVNYLKLESPLIVSNTESDEVIYYLSLQCESWDGERLLYNTIYDYIQILDTTDNPITSQYFQLDEDISFCNENSFTSWIDIENQVTFTQWTIESLGYFGFEQQSEPAGNDSQSTESTQIIQVTQALPQVGNDVGGFMSNMFPVVIAFMVGIAIILGIVGIFNSVMHVMTKMLNRGSNRK